MDISSLYTLAREAIRRSEFPAFPREIKASATPGHSAAHQPRPLEFDGNILLCPVCKSDRVQLLGVTSVQPAVMSMAANNYVKSYEIPEPEEHDPFEPQITVTVAMQCRICGDKFCVGIGNVLEHEQEGKVRVDSIWLAAGEPVGNLFDGANPKPKPEGYG